MRRSGLIAFFTVAGMAVIGWRALAQELPPPQFEKVEIQRANPLKPLNEIRFDHHLTDKQDQIVPQPVELPPSTAEFPAQKVKSVHWVAANLHYNQPYFEEYCLERYGVNRGPILQPAVSAKHFFTTGLLLPALMQTDLRCQVYDHRDRR